MPLGRPYTSEEKEKLNSIIGTSVSIDISTGDHDAGYRIFAKVIEWVPCGEKDVTLISELDYDNREIEGMERIPIPRTADEAEMMERIGYAWLESNAPERLQKRRTLRDLMDHYSSLKEIIESDISWKLKFDLGFKIKATLIDPIVKIDYYDPDTSYEEDIMAYFNALTEELGNEN